MKSDKNIRVEQAAKILDCSDRHIYRLAAEGQIVTFKIGKAKGLRIVESSLYDFIQRQKDLAELENGFLLD